MNKRQSGAGRGRLVLLGVCAWLLLACGGGGRGAEPTALPAEAVVPNQPTVVFPTLAPIAPAPTLTPEPTPDEQPTPTWTPFALPTRDLSQVILDAMAIPQQVVTLHTAPNGAVTGNVPSDQILTAVARSADGYWLAVYTEDNQTGWVALDAVHLYGGDLLPVTDTLPARPDLIRRARAQAGAAGFPADPRAQAVGTVTGDGLRVRNAPTTEGAILANLSLNAEVSVLGRTATGDWLKISLWGIAAAEDAGWVFAQFVQLDQDLNALSVTD